MVLFDSTNRHCCNSIPHNQGVIYTHGVHAVSSACLQVDSSYQEADKGVTPGHHQQSGGELYKDDPCCLCCRCRRWTPAIKKQIKESRLDITSKVAVSNLESNFACATGYSYWLQLHTSKVAVSSSCSSSQVLMPTMPVRLAAGSAADSGYVDAQATEIAS
jgi:hypothetical protein